MVEIIDNYLKQNTTCAVCSFAILNLGFLVFCLNIDYFLGAEHCLMNKEEILQKYHCHFLGHLSDLYCTWGDAGILEWLIDNTCIGSPFFYLYSERIHQLPELRVYFIL